MTWNEKLYDKTYIVEEYLNNNKNQYMITIARDNEPVRSVYKFDDALNAVNGYNEYTDWGFAKHFLTVKMYEPNGKIHEKVLKRPPAGECVFVREQYYQAEKALLKVKNYLSEDIYTNLIKDFALIFSLDSWRFDHIKFFKLTESKESVE
jgi:lipoate synthase